MLYRCKFHNFLVQIITGPRITLGIIPDTNRTGIIDPEAVEKLIVETAKAFNYYSDTWGPIFEATCKERQEHCARQVKLAKITRGRQQKEIDRVVRRYIAREQTEGLGKLSSEGITEEDIAGYKADMSHVQKVKKKKGKKK